MAKIFECDRCKKISSEKKIIKYKGQSFQPFLGLGLFKCELCEDCANEFYDWLYSKKSFR